MTKHCLANSIGALVASVSLVYGSHAYAQSPAPYPTKPIKWIVPTTAGGLTDVVTRLAAEKMQSSLGQPIVVENKPGANGIVGLSEAAKSQPDGYTIVSVFSGHTVNATLYAGQFPYDGEKRFQGITLAVQTPFILVGSNTLPTSNFKELIEYARKNPGKLSYGSNGIGSGGHLAVELVKQNAEFFAVHIPYKGMGGALTDLMSGNIQLYADVPLAMMPHVRSGKIKALAVLSDRRAKGAEEVPTAAEAGLPIQSVGWIGALTPEKTPSYIIEKISFEMRKALTSDDVRASLEKRGAAIVANTPKEFESFLEVEVAKWANVIKAAGIRREN
jgi:tripartite-type tricarboxylate transporter receptor subunit TctC